MKYAFFGTPRFAAIILEKLITSGLPPALVVCNPDKPSGRKQLVTSPATKVVAEKYGITVWQPEKLIFDECADKLSSMDFAVVAAYAKIIPEEIIATPRLKMIGVHPSLLPKYRGTTPIQTVILNGEAESGATLFMLDAKVDHGAILAQEKSTLVATETYTSLEEKLALLSGNLLVKTLPEFAQGKITPATQNEREATMTKKFKTEDGLVDLDKNSPTEIYRKIRALNPQPGAYAMHNGTRIKILDRETIQYESKKPRKVKDAIFYLKSL